MGSDGYQAGMEGVDLGVAFKKGRDIYVDGYNILIRQIFPRLRKGVGEGGCWIM